MLLKIGVLFGGLSAEHEVSIKSAISIIKNLNTDKYIIIVSHKNFIKSMVEMIYTVDKKEK